MHKTTKKIRKEKMLIILLLFVSFLFSTGTFAYWSTYVEGTNTSSTGVLSIGSGDNVETAFTITNESNSLGFLVPENQLQNSLPGSVDIVYLSYDLQWNEDELVSQLSGNTQTYGDVQVTHGIAIYKDGELLPYSGNEKIYSLIHVEHNELNPNQLILDATAETFRFTVTMDEPANQEEYNIISLSDIEITLQFNILDSSITTTDIDQSSDNNETPSVYKVIYYDTDNTVIYTQDVQEGNGLTDFVIPDNPTKDGYTFTTWSSNLPEVMPSQDIEIYANYIINQYTITFEENGGSEVADLTGDFESTVFTPEEPTKEGYIFTGWYSAPEYSSEYEFTTMPSEDATVYVGWTATVEQVESIITNHKFENLDLCSGTESANVEAEVLRVLNDPFITVDYVTDHGDGSFTIDLTQTYNDTTTYITVNATFLMCAEYPNNLLAEAQEEIEVLIPTGLFDDIKVPNLNERTKTEGINNRLQVLKDKYNVTIDVVYDDSVKDNGSPLTDTTGMTGTAMGMIITITLEYDGIIVTDTFEVVASFDQSKEEDIFIIPDTFTPY